MAIPINDNYYPYAPKHLDARYGPYQSVEQALEMVGVLYRVKGLVVGILQGDAVVEHWFKDGVGDEDLVVKTEHERLHAINSTDDHAVAEGSDRGKYVRADPVTGEIVFANVAEIEFGHWALVVYWRYVGEAEWNELIDISGIAGMKPEFRADDGWIQWRISEQTPEDDWKNLIHVDDLTKHPIFRVEDNLLQWKYDDQVEWITLADLSRDAMRKVLLTIATDEQTVFTVPEGISTSYVILNGVHYIEPDYEIEGTTLTWADNGLETDDELILYYLL